MSQDAPLVCFDCGKAFCADDGRVLDDDEFRCFDCAENEVALFKVEQRERKLDDPLHQS